MVHIGRWNRLGVWFIGRCVKLGCGILGGVSDCGMADWEVVISFSV